MVSVIGVSRCARLNAEGNRSWLSIFTYLTQHRYSELAVITENLLAIDKSENFLTGLELGTVNYYYAYLKLLAMQANLMQFKYEKVSDLNKKYLVQKTRLDFSFAIDCRRC